MSIAWLPLILLGVVARASCQVPAAQDTNEYIILATERNISRLLLPAGSPTVLPIDQLTFPHSVEFDVRHNCVFWADYTRIVRQCLDDKSNRVELLVSHGVLRIQDIAYDWRSEKLYYVDENRIYAIDTSASATSAANGWSHWPTTIVHLSDGETTGIAVHPDRGYLFWTQSPVGENASAAGIFRSDLDGTNEVRLQSAPNVEHPVKISVDYINDQLYWIDARPKTGSFVGSCGVHGGKFTRHFSLAIDGEEPAQSQLLLSAYNDVVYWLDAGNNIRASDIRYLDDRGAASVSVVIAQSEEAVRDFKAYYRGAQLGTNACSNGRHNCTHFCVGASSNSFRCMCNDGLTLTVDGCRCDAEDDFDCFTKLVDKSCNGGTTMYCDKKVCLPHFYRCDGVPNCVDGSDESPSLCAVEESIFDYESYFLLSIIASVIILLILVLVAIFLWRRCKNKRQQPIENPNAAYY